LPRQLPADDPDVSVETRTNTTSCGLDSLGAGPQDSLGPEERRTVARPGDVSRGRSLAELQVGSVPCTREDWACTQSPASPKIGGYPLTCQGDHTSHSQSLVGGVPPRKLDWRHSMTSPARTAAMLFWTIRRGQSAKTSPSRSAVPSWVAARTGECQNHEGWRSTTIAPPRRLVAIPGRRRPQARPAALRSLPSRPR
jgi:hypothetical protein